MAKSLPQFDTVANQFLQQGAFCSPAELHGSLCGQLAAGGRYEDEKEWLQAACGLMDIGELNDPELARALVDIFEISTEQLGGSDFSFDLLMPDDETVINQRAESLGNWCEGFLAGYATAGGKVDSNLSDEAKETLRDLITISQIALDTDEDDSNEADFAEVYEYVRMSTLLIYAECNTAPIEESVPPGEQIH